MKTKNNVQKTFWRTAAVIASLVLISITVSAQEFWKKLIMNNSFNEIAIAMSDSGQKKGVTDKTDVYHFVESETMKTTLTPDGESTVKHLPVPVTQIENEPCLELENWMISERWFNGSEPGNASSN